MCAGKNQFYETFITADENVVNFFLRNHVASFYRLGVQVNWANSTNSSLSGSNEQKVWIQWTKSRTMKHGRLTLEIDNILSGKNLSRKHWGKQWEKALCPIELSELNKLLRVVWIQWTKSLDSRNKKIWIQWTKRPNQQSCFPKYKLTSCCEETTKNKNNPYT